MLRVSFSSYHFISIHFLIFFYFKIIFSHRTVWDSYFILFSWTHAVFSLLLLFISYLFVINFITFFSMTFRYIATLPTTFLIIHCTTKFFPLLQFSFPCKQCKLSIIISQSLISFFLFHFQKKFFRRNELQLYNCQLMRFFIVRILVFLKTLKLIDFEGYVFSILIRSLLGHMWKFWTKISFVLYDVTFMIDD